MINVALFNCFHDMSTLPEKKYCDILRIPVLCGAGLKTIGEKDEMRSVLGDALHFDDECDKSISNYNGSYSEITGYQYIANNHYIANKYDIVGVEHYRRHFVKMVPRVHYSDYDNTFRLLNRKDIIEDLTYADAIIASPFELAYTSVYDLYKGCWPEKVEIVMKASKEFFKLKPDTYMKAFMDNMSGNKCWRANLLIMPYRDFKKYTEFLMEYLACIKKALNLSDDDTDRTLGYWAEYMPMIYIQGSGMLYKEEHVICDNGDKSTPLLDRIECSFYTPEEKTNDVTRNKTLYHLEQL